MLILHLVIQIECVNVRGVRNFYMEFPEYYLGNNINIVQYSVNRSQSA